MQSQPNLPLTTYLRLPDMKIRYRVSGSTIWNWCRTNNLPAPMKLGANTTCWKLDDLLKWEQERMSASKKGGAE